MPTIWAYIKDVKYINRRDVQRKNAVNNVDKSTLFGTTTKQTVPKHTEHHKTLRMQRRNRQLEITYFVVFLFFIFIFHLDVQNTNGPYRNPHNITKTQYTKMQQTFRNQYFCCCFFFRVFSYCLVRMKIIQTTCWVSQPLAEILCTEINCKISAHIMHIYVKQ